MKTGMDIVDLEIALELIQHEMRNAIDEKVDVMSCENFFRKFPYLRGYYQGKYEVLKEFETKLLKVLKTCKTRQGLENNQ